MVFRTVASLAALAIVQTAWAEPPKVTKANPDDGSKNVDPALKELRIEFDQPMSPDGWSVVGGGPTFPKFVGKGRWLDDRTLVWSWQLAPEHDYWLSINSDRFTNFRNPQGEPAVAYPIAFRTAPRAGSGQDPTSSAAELSGRNREALGHLRRAINDDYSYRDRRSVNWDDRFKLFAPKLESASSTKAFAETAAQLLAPAEDIHLWLEADGQVVPTYRRYSTGNVATASLPQRIPGWRQRSSIVFTGAFDDGIRYVCIRSWPANAADELEPAYDLLAEAAKEGKALIIDVRANGGGSEDLAARFAGCFVDRPVVYARHVHRSGGKFSEPINRTLQPNKARPQYRGRVAVLMGLGTVSSCESFVMMMKQVRGCTLIGERTAGSSGNPSPVDLGNGVSAFVPSWRSLRVDGTCLEGEGFAPDVEVRASPGDFRAGDPVLDAALKRLREAR